MRIRWTHAAFTTNHKISHMHRWWRRGIREKLLFNVAFTAQKYINCSQELSFVASNFFALCWIWSSFFLVGWLNWNQWIETQCRANGIDIHRHITILFIGCFFFVFSSVRCDDISVKLMSSWNRLLDVRLCLCVCASDLQYRRFCHLFQINFVVMHRRGAFDVRWTKKCPMKLVAAVGKAALAQPLHAYIDKSALHHSTVCSDAYKCMRIPWQQWILKVAIDIRLAHRKWLTRIALKVRAVCETSVIVRQ